MRLLFYALIVLNFSSCYLTRAYKYRKLELNDVHRMPSVTIPKSDEPYYFTDGTKTHQYENLNTYLDTNLAKSRTAAGWLATDVTDHTSDKMLVADFGNNISSVRPSALTEPVWTSWKSIFLTDGSYRIRILGFSDCSGSEAVNIAIRLARSRAIKNAFGAGITPKVSEQTGAPIAETVVANDTPENRAKNRSVVVQHKQGFFTEPAAPAAWAN